MESQSDQPPLIAIVGETASGKTSLAIDLAKRFSGEIIAADSRTVYRGMDIGTAKPTPEERTAVPHHLLDVVEPGDTFSVADFKRLAEKAMATITERGHIPFLVGGTGLYVDAMLYNFGFLGGPNRELRKSAQELSVEELQAQLLKAGIPFPKNSRNARHLIRALETGGRTPQREVLRSNTLILGLEIDREELRRKLKLRVEQMVEQGLIEEVERLAQNYGWDAPALQAPGYRALREYLQGHLSLEEAKEKFVQNDYQLAKRQRTWFRRNNDILWICKKDDAVDIVTTFLNKVPIA